MLFVVIIVFSFTLVLLSRTKLCANMRFFFQAHFKILLKNKRVKLNVSKVVSPYFKIFNSAACNFYFTTTTTTELIYCAHQICRHCFACHVFVCFSFYLFYFSYFSSTRTIKQFFHSSLLFSFVRFFFFLFYISFLMRILIQCIYFIHMNNISRETEEERPK